jgi:hypothetical protein
MAEPVPITASLDGIMKSLRGTDRIQIGGVFGKWPDAVGENVAAHDSAWATQVKFLSGTISARLAEVANVQVSRIDVRVARTR